MNMSRRRALLGAGKDKSIIVDCPLDGNLNDVSGNGNHLGVNVVTSPFVPAFVVVDSRYVLYANSDMDRGQITLPQSFVNSWINNCRVEIEIQRTNLNSDYPNYIDSSNSSQVGGIFCQVESNVF